jgi:quercetin dioxygenase-like cupin family protein
VVAFLVESRLRAFDPLVRFIGARGPAAQEGGNTTMNTPPASELIRVGQIEICFRLQAAQTDGQLTMFDFRVPAQARVPIPHSHVAYDETIYGLDGVLSWTVEGRKIDVGPGDVLFIRRGVVHGFENLGASDARQLAVVTPGILGPEFFREMAEVINAGGPPDFQKIRAVMQRHGLQPAPQG